MLSSIPRRRTALSVAISLVALAPLTFDAGAARAGTVTMQACFGQALSTDWQAANVPPSAGVYSEADNCPTGGRFQILNSGLPGLQGQSAQWNTVVPAGMGLTSVNVPAQAALINTSTQNLGGSSGIGVRYLWAGGSVSLADGGGSGFMHYAAPVSGPISGRYFIVQAACNVAGFCSATSGEPVLGSEEIVDVRDLTLTAVDNSPPSVIANGAGNVFYTGGHQWIRGAGWPASFTASAVDGVCGTRALIGPSDVEGPQYPNDHTRWQQCPSPVTQNLTLDTTQYLNGPLPLILSARDAASPANVSSPSTTLYVDNAPVSLSLTGRNDVAASAANASTDITATATAGPSGANIFCSVDGGPEVEYSGASARAPVSGLGLHQASCFAQNSAIDPNGAPGRSAPQTFDVSIRQPTAEAITFAHIADALRCRRVVEKIKVRGRTRVVKRHGRNVLVRGRSHTVKRRVRRCHARTVKRRVRVVLRRHGKPVKRRGKVVYVRRTRRVVVLPHTVFRAKRRVGHGKPTTVSGYLGLADGTPLADRTVSVIAAANNGLGQFTLPVATVTTSASGIWTARVPAGPSRLIEAVFGGDATSEPAVSAPVTLSVPAKIAVSIAPHQLPWSHKIRIRGRLVGGYVPADGVALRLLVRYPHSKRRTPVQALRTDAAGRFDFTWSYHAGRSVATYPFSVATTATESDYAFAASSSRQVPVTFGRATPPPRTHHHKRHHHTARHHHKRHRHRLRHHHAKHHHQGRHHHHRRRRR